MVYDTSKLEELAVLATSCTADCPTGGGMMANIAKPIYIWVAESLSRNPPELVGSMEREDTFIEATRGIARWTLVGVATLQKTNVDLSEVPFHPAKGYLKDPCRLPLPKTVEAKTCTDRKLYAGRMRKVLDVASEVDLVLAQEKLAVDGNPWTDAQRLWYERYPDWGTFSD